MHPHPSLRLSILRPHHLKQKTFVPNTPALFPTKCILVVQTGDFRSRQRRKEEETFNFQCLYDFFLQDELIV